MKKLFLCAVIFCLFNFHPSHANQDIQKDVQTLLKVADMYEEANWFLFHGYRESAYFNIRLSSDMLFSYARIPEANKAQKIVMALMDDFLTGKASQDILKKFEKNQNKFFQYIDHGVERLKNSKP